MQPNPEIEQIINNSCALAKDYRHNYVTLEHLLISLVEFKSFNKLLVDYGVEAEELLRDLYDYIGKQNHLVVDTPLEELAPMRTHSLERVFNRAFTQVLFSGRTHVQIIDIFLSLAAETNSHASYFFIKYGLERSQVVEFYNNNYVEINITKIDFIYSR